MFRNCLHLLNSHVILPRPILAVGSPSVPWYSTTSLYPDRPKRPKSAWLFYLQENISRIKEQNPSFSNADVFRRIASDYKSLDSNAHEKYKQLSQNESVAYKKQMEVYQAGLTPDVKLALAKDKFNVKAREHKKQLKALGMPKKPPNAYIFFAMDYVQKNFEKPADAFKESRKIGTAWNNLPVGEKSKWNEMAATKEQEYRINLKQWEDEMTAQGLLQVIQAKGKKK